MLALAEPETAHRPHAEHQRATAGLGVVEGAAVDHEVPRGGPVLGRERVRDRLQSLGIRYRD